MGIFTLLQLYTAFCIYHFDTNLPEPICDVSFPFSGALSEISNKINDTVYEIKIKQLQNDQIYWQSINVKHPFLRHI